MCSLFLSYLCFLSLFLLYIFLSVHLRRLWAVCPCIIFMLGKLWILWKHFSFRPKLQFFVPLHFSEWPHAKMRFFISFHKAIYKYALNLDLLCRLHWFVCTRAELPIWAKIDRTRMIRLGKINENRKKKYSDPTLKEKPSRQNDIQYSFYIKGIMD